MSDASCSDQRKSRAGMVAVQVTGGSALFVCLLCAPFLIVPAIHRIPWMATPPHIVRRAVQLASKYDDKGRHGLKVWMDLGSGDGRLPIDAVATGGYDRSVGFELNPVLIALSQWRYYFSPARKEGKGSVTFERSDFWKTDLEDATVVSCFGIEAITARLAEKVTTEGQDGLQLVCFRFRPKPPLPSGLVQTYSNREEELYIFRVDRKNQQEQEQEQEQ